LRNRRFARDLEEELEFHRRMAEQDLGSAEAARRAMGNETLMREEARAVWLAPWLESVWQDLRYAIRSLRQAPGFTLAAAGALALAIGINTSYFTVFNSIAIRPWPVADPGRIVTLFSHSPSSMPGGFSLAEYRYLRDHARSLNGMAAYRQTAVRFGFESAGKASNAQFVSANFLDVLGTGLAAGRGFRSDEDRPEAPAAVAILSFQTWRTRFGSDPAIIGRTVRVDEIPFVIVGVTAEEFTGVTPGQTAAYVPFASMRLLPREKTHSMRFLIETGHCCSSVTARLAPGASRADAKAELEVLSRQFRQANGLDARGIAVGGTQLFFTPGAKTEMRTGFGLMFLGVVLLLLLACANVGNLCLARAAARAREFAIRGSLGAGRARLIRQLLTEGLVVAAVAVVPGVAIAFWLPQALIATMTDDMPSLRLTPDATVLLYAVLLAILATVLFALTPALAGTKQDLHTALKSGGSGAGSRFRLRMLLLGAQTALSVILLVAAGLMVRGVQRVASVDPGFAVDDVSAIEMDLPAEMYAEDKVKLLSEALVHEIALLPDTALSLNTPLANVRHSTGFRIPGRTNNTWKPRRCMRLRRCTSMCSGSRCSRDGCFQPSMREALP
jgi:predicted permease